MLAISPLQAQTMQDIQASFLQSMPDNIAADFQSQLDIEQEKEYPSPDTRIRNLEQALLDAEQTLINIRDEIEQSDNSSTSLQRYGSSFFNSFQSTFMPTNQPNLDSSYHLDTNDELTLQLVGQRNETFPLKVKRDGSINVPEVGKIYVSGLTLDSAKQLIQNRLQESFVNIKVFTTLSEVRDIGVLAVGNVNNPGMYILAGSSSPLSLIDAAGGVSSNGSYRKILHKRSNEVINEIDLYQVIANGDIVFDYSLREGDVLVVPPKGPEVKISGSVANEAIYEFKDTETLGHSLSIAGPISTKHIQGLNIKRVGDNQKLDDMSLDLDSADSFILSDGDTIDVLGLQPNLNKVNKITITGEVSLPGTYSLKDGLRVSDLIELAGGYKKNAYFEGGVLIREEALLMEETIKEKSFNEMVKFIVTGPRFNMSPQPEGVLKFLINVKNYKPSGRVITEFNLAKLKSNPNLDRVLNDGDRIHIPRFSRTVYVYGEVVNPGSVNFDGISSPHEYLERAGGFSSIADQNRVVIVAPNGEATYFDNGRFNLFNKLPEIQPGSLIYAPTKIGKLDGINLASEVAPIVSSLALSIASLNSIN